MLRTLATARVGGARRPLPGSSRSAALLTSSRQSSQSASAAERDAAARAARMQNRKPLAGPRTLPTKRVGLYDPALEKDSCGVGLAVQMKSVASRQVTDDMTTNSIFGKKNYEHRAKYPGTWFIPDQRRWCTYTKITKSTGKMQ